MGTRGDQLYDLVETYNRETADVQKMFGDEGRSLSRMYRRRRESAYGSPRAYERKFLEAVRFIGDIYDGIKPTYLLREALGTADFPLLFGDVIDRQLLANYRETPQTYRNYCKVSTVPDFRQVKRFAINYGEGRLPLVGQQEEYPEDKMADAVFQYSVKKYGKKIPFDWETMINDDLDALKDVPMRFGRSARRTEEFFATSLFVDANGPIAGFFNTANKNRVHTENGASSNNPALSIQALQDAYTVLKSMVDFNGEPIVIEGVHLVVPPALEIVANNIMNATELWINLATATVSPPNQQIHTANWIRDKTKLSVNYYLPHIATSANGSTAWYLFADPNSSRPAVEVGFLRGHEEPEIFAKDPNATRIGGGSADLFDGDFDNDAIQYKVRHVIGGTLIDPRAVVASNGSGT